MTVFMGLGNSYTFTMTVSKLQVQPATHPSVICGPVFYVVMRRVIV